MKIDVKKLKKLIKNMEESKVQTIIFRNEMAIFLPTTTKKYIFYKNFDLMCHDIHLDSFIKKVRNVLES